MQKPAPFLLVLIFVLLIGIPDSTTSISKRSLTENFYHGTNSIFGYYVCQGINLNAGRDALDFNAKNTKSFYLTKDRALAEKWASAKAMIFGGSPIVIRYLVSSNFRNAFKGKILDDRKEWAEFVRLSRANANDHSFDFVEGMILKNPGQDGEAQGYGHQLAINKKHLATYFSQNLAAGCENVSEPPNADLCDDTGEVFKKIPQDSFLDGMARSLIYRVRDAQVFLLEASTRYIKKREPVRIANIAFRQQLGLLPAVYSAQWDSKHHYLITSYIPGQTLLEMFDDETFWELESKRRTKLIALVHNLIAKRIFVRGMSPENLIYSSGRWFLIHSRELSFAQSPALCLKLFAHDPTDSFARLWLSKLTNCAASSFSLPIKKKRVQQLIADILDTKVGILKIDQLRPFTLRYLNYPFLKRGDN